MPSLAEQGLCVVENRKLGIANLVALRAGFPPTLISRPVLLGEVLGLWETHAGHREVHGATK